MVFKINSITEIKEVASSFLKFLKENPLQKNNNILAFYGKMGVGKTTFIKTLCEILNVEDEVNSPTFSLINEYFTSTGESIYHFDFYRIESIEEAYDFGYEDYLYSQNLCLIEWPELIEELLPENFTKIEITENEDNSRSIKVS